MAWYTKSMNSEPIPSWEKETVDPYAWENDYGVQRTNKQERQAAGLDDFTVEDSLRAAQRLADAANQSDLPESLKPIVPPVPAEKSDVDALVTFMREQGKNEGEIEATLAQYGLGHHR